MRSAASLVLWFAGSCALPWPSSSGCFSHAKHTSSSILTRATPNLAVHPRLVDQNVDVAAMSLDTAFPVNRTTHWLDRWTFPQAALRTTAACLVLYGTTGLVAPATLHTRLFRQSSESLTRRVKARYRAFALREWMVAAMALWLSRALTFSNDTWKDHYIFSIMLLLTEIVLVPYLFGCLGRERGHHKG